MTSMLPDPATNGDAVPVLPTRVSLAEWDEHLYFGHRLFEDLTGTLPLAGLVGMAVSGRRLDAEQCALLDEMAGSLGIADPHIWPLKVTRLASAYGRPLPAVAAGALLFDSDYVGPLAIGHCASALVAISEAIGGTPDADRIRASTRAYLAKHGRICGFGVPFRDIDERLVALRRCVERRGRHVGHFWRMSKHVAEAVKQEKNIEPNIGLGIASAALDLGFEPRHIGVLAFAFTFPPQLANSVEGAAQAPEVLRELPAEFIEYVGAPPRKSPRAERAESSLP
jgi:hypothetical protein